MKHRILVITLLFSTLAQAKMYQWVDDKGRAHFSDKPPAVAIEKPSISKSAENVKEINKYSSHSSNSSNSASKSLVIDLESNSLLVLQVRKLLKKKKYQELNNLLDQAQVAALDDVSAEENLLQLYQAFSLTSEAFEQQLNEWVNTYPASYQPFLARARYFQVKGWRARGTKWGSETSDKQKSKMKIYISKAQADIKKALNRNPSSSMAYVLLIQGSYASSDFNELDNIFKKGIKISPASYELRQSYLRRQRPRWGGSLERMLEVIVESEKLIDQNPRLINLASWVLEDIALSQYGSGSYTLAKETLSKGLLKVKNSAIQHGYADVKEDHFISYRQGKIEMRLENYNAALNFFALAIKGNENVADYYYERSRVYEELNDYAKSTRDLVTALAIDPLDEHYITFKKRLINNLNYASYEAKSNVKLTKALQLVNFSLQLDPNHIKSLRRRSYIYIDKRQISQAKADMDKAIELDLSDYDSYKGMDDVLLMERRFEEVATYWGQYIALKPNDSRAFFERAGTYYHMKRIDLAVKDARRAVTLGHPNAAESLDYYERLLIGGARR